MTRIRLALAALALLLTTPLLASPYLRGVGAVAVNSQADIDAILRELVPTRHIGRCSLYWLHGQRSGRHRADRS